MVKVVTISLLNQKKDWINHKIGYILFELNLILE